jgi:hypothetical protein
VLAALSENGGGWLTTRNKARYGCFLPDLTGLASISSAANLPDHYIRGRRPGGKPEKANSEMPSHE